MKMKLLILMLVISMIFTSTNAQTQGGCTGKEKSDNQAPRQILQNLLCQGEEPNGLRVTSVKTDAQFTLTTNGEKMLKYTASDTFVDVNFTRAGLPVNSAKYFLVKIPAENVLYYQKKDADDKLIDKFTNRSHMELQIVFDVNTKNKYILSFFFNKSSEPEKYLKNIPTSLSTANINFDWLYDAVNPAENFERNTKYFKYDGTLTIGECDSGYTWFVFDKVRTINADTYQNLLTYLGIGNLGDDPAFLKDLGNARTNTYKALNITTDEGLTAAGCWNTDYFELQIRYNWALWVLVGSVLLFFILAVGSNKDTEVVGISMRNNAWTLHPFYSIYYVGAEYFTKTSRLTILWVGIGVKIIVISLVYYELKQTEQEDGVWIIYSALVGVFISIFPQYIFGLIMRLNLKYQTERIERRKRNQDDDSYAIEGSYYIFYILAILAVLASLIMSIVILEGKTQEVQGFWFAAIWVAVFIDHIILDTIVVFVCKAMPGLIDLFKYRGFYFEYEIYNDYMKLD